MNTFKKVTDHNNVSGNDKRTCEFFEELSDILGYKPMCSRSQLSSAGSGDKRRHSEYGNRVPEKKKKKYVPAAESTNKALLSWLEEIQKRREEREEWRLQEMREMHQEKCEMFREYLDILKSRK